MATVHLRKEYTLAGLRRKDLDPNPFQQFDKWFQQALQTQAGEPHAMTLATADKRGRPSARIVLLREANEHGFVFYTNYESQKGHELIENPHAALVFYWADLERQICVTGSVSKISQQESETYFKSRPEGSRLAAWVSRQSRVIRDREALEEELEKVTQKYNKQEIPLPPYWGGYVLSPMTIEFWQGRPNRLHDRFRYSRQANGFWIIERLSP